MRITVRLFATFRDGRKKEQILDLPEGTTVGNIVDQLGIDRSEVAILLINGRDGKLDSSLKEADVLALFPPVGGG